MKELHKDVILEEEFDYMGHHCVILYMSDMGHRCGYLSVPVEMATFEWEELFWIHGGVTFQGNIQWLNDGRYYIGFDCMHAGDRPSYNTEHVRMMRKLNRDYHKSGHFWSRKDVKRELKEAIWAFHIGKHLLAKL